MNVSAKSYIELCGIQGNLLGWIRNFLTNREQRTVLNGAQSSTEIVTSGNTQGSVLGPVVFTIYIYDLPHLVSNTTKLSADDATTCSVVNNGNDRDDLQNGLKQLDNWPQDWLLKFNPEKCSHLHLGKNTGTSYELSNITLKNKRAKMALIAHLIFLDCSSQFFCCRFQRRIYKNFFMSVQCKKPPFTNTMFIDKSKFQEQF